MPVMKRVFGLDVGTHSIKGVELRQTFRGVEPVQLRIEPYDEATPPRDRLMQFVETYQFPTDNIVCALPGDRLSSHRLSFPFRDRKRLRQAVGFGVEAEIPFDLEDILIDWEIVAGGPREATVAAVLAQRRDIARILDDFESAGCTPRILEAEGPALANLADVFALQENQLLVDLGHSKTTLCLLVDQKPAASRSFPIGARHVTDALAQDLACDRVEAERRKCEAGLFGADLRSPYPAAASALDRIANEIARSLDGMEPILGGSSEAQLDCLTLLGGGARLHRIDEYLTGRIGIVARRLSLPPDSEDASLVAGGDPTLFGPAMALALRGTARAKTRMNFRQEEFAYRTNFSALFGRDMRSTGILAGSAAALLCASVATSVALESGQAGQMENRSAGIYESIFPGEPVPDNPVATLSRKLQSAQERAEFLGVYGENQSALDLLTRLSQAVPSNLDILFEEITIEPKLIRIKASGATFETADQVIGSLHTDVSFAQARVTGETTRKKERIAFSITIPLTDEGVES